MKSTITIVITYTLYCRSRFGSWLSVIAVFELPVIRKIETKEPGFTVYFVGVYKDGEKNEKWRHADEDAWCLPTRTNTFLDQGFPTPPEIGMRTNG
jgi:hypothetical protein